MKKIFYKLISNFLKIFDMNKTTVDSKLQSMLNHLNNLQATSGELKNAEVVDPFLTDTLEKNMEIINSIIMKMKNENEQREDALKHIKKF